MADGETIIQQIREVVRSEVAPKFDALDNKLEGYISEVNERFDHVEEGLAHLLPMVAKFESIDNRLANVEISVDTLTVTTAQLSTDMKHFHRKLDRMDERFDRIEDKLERVELNTAVTASVVGQHAEDIQRLKHHRH